MRELYNLLRDKKVVIYPHTAGARSARLAAAIAALPEQTRTPLQEQMLHQHERGECIGCTTQGVPVDATGRDVMFRYEPNGFAAPPEYCDCPKGQQYQRWVEQQRARRMTFSGFKTISVTYATSLDLPVSFLPLQQVGR